jgi:hypothetical protein
VSRRRYHGSYGPTPSKRQIAAKARADAFLKVCAKLRRRYTRRDRAEIDQTAKALVCGLMAVDRLEA